MPRSRLDPNPRCEAQVYNWDLALLKAQNYVIFQSRLPNALCGGLGESLCHHPSLVVGGFDSSPGVVHYRMKPTTLWTWICVQ